MFTSLVLVLEYMVLVGMLGTMVLEDRYNHILLFFIAAVVFFVPFGLTFALKIWAWPFLLHVFLAVPVAYVFALLSIGVTLLLMKLVPQ